MLASQGKEDPPMKFGRNTDRFKSGFGNEGSQIIKKSKQQQQVRETYRVQEKDFAASQKIDVNQLRNVGSNSAE